MLTDGLCLPGVPFSWGASVSQHPPDSTVPGYGSSSSSPSTLIFSASTPSCPPHVKAPSLTISLPELVPTRMLKTSYLPTLRLTQRKFTHLRHTSEHADCFTPTPPCPVPSIQFFSPAQKGRGAARNPRPRYIFKWGKITSLFYCSTSMWVILLKCLHYLKWWQRAHLSSLWWKSFSPSTIHFPWGQWLW